MHSDGGDDAAGADEVERQARRLRASDHLQDRVRSPPFRCVFHDPARIVLPSVDGRRAESAGEGEPLREDVDGEDAFRSPVVGPENGEEADGTAADHGVDAAGPSLGHVRAEESGREDVPEEERRLHVHVGRDLHERRIGEGDPHVLRLGAFEAPALLDPPEELPSRAAAGEAFSAVEARSAVGRERGDHEVARFQSLHSLSDLDDLAEKLVAHDRSRLDALFAPEIDVQVRPADGAHAVPDDDILGVAERGVGYGRNLDPGVTLKRDGFHMEAVLALGWTFGDISRRVI